MFGHAPPFVTAAMAEQLEHGMQLGPQTALAGEVARGIRELVGCERVHFCNTGSEAVLAALRLARTVTGRDRIAFFTGSYHGINDGVLARAVDAAGRVVPAAPGIPRQAVADSLVLDYNRAESLETIARHAGELAAVLVEPLQAGRPAVDPREFLGRLRELSALLPTLISGARAVMPGGDLWLPSELDERIRESRTASAVSLSVPRICSTKCTPPWPTAPHASSSTVSPDSICLSSTNVEYLVMWSQLPRTRQNVGLSSVNST
ncbi:MAG: aminotransferase class III-fold pyridoxal phosphate-dependent enzyme [bacterium]|nr:aminotransferase class III-fold pyridoxal phosphate-dependent enzyme [bacterium]